MKYTEHKHAAVNLHTGEVLTSSTGNALRRHVARRTKADIEWAKQFNYPFTVSHKWVFAHGTDWGKKLQCKYR